MTKVPATPAAASVQGVGRAAAMGNDDAGGREQAEERIAQLSRARAILAGIDRAIVRIPDRQKLLDEVCRVAVEVGGFKLAWVGMAAPDGSVQPVAQAGATGYLEGIRVVTGDEPEGRGPSGTAIRENRPVVVEEADGDPRTIPWHGRLRQFGLRYVAAFPIQISGNVAGALQVYAPRAHFFDEQELGLLTQMSEDVSFALTAISDLAARKQAEEALREASELNRQMIAAAKDGIVVYGRDLKCLVWNPTMEDLTGTSAAEVLGKHPLEVFPFLEGGEVMKRLQRTVAGETCAEAEFPLRPTRGGRSIWVSSRSSAIRNARGEITGGLSIVRDITERKQAEAALHEASELNQQMIAAANDGIVVYDRDLKCLIWNPALEKLTETPASQVLGRGLFEVFPFLQQTEIKKRIERNLAGEPCPEVETLLHPPHMGHPVWISDTLSAIRNARGEIIGGMSIIRDITARKQAEAALRDAGELTRQMIASAKDGISVFDRELKYLVFNPAMEKITSTPASEVLGKRIFDAFPFLLETGLVKRLEKTLAGEPCPEQEVLLHPPHTGRPIWISHAPSALRNARGEIIGGVSILRDITERKQAEEMLRASQQITEGIINAIPVRVFWKDKNLDFLGCNAAFARDAGFADPKDIIGKNDFQMAWREQAEMYRRDDRQVIESGCPKLLIEESQTTPEGKTIALLTSKIPLYNSKGEISGVLVTYMDISERKRTEDALRRSEAKFRTLFNCTGDAVMMLDEKGFFDCNAATVAMFGCASAEDFILKHPGDLSPRVQPDGSDSRTQADRHIAIARKKGSHQFEWMHKRADTGAVFPADVLLSAMELDGKQVLQATVRDISDRKQAEERIAKLNRVQTIMASIDRAIVHIGDRQKLLDEVCRVAVEEGGFKLAWVGMVAPDGSVLPVAKAGVTEYLDSGRVSVHDAPEGRGPTGTAIRENRPVVVEGADQDPRLALWHDHLRKFGMRYIAAFPIRIAGKVVGAFQVYAREANFFNENEVRLLTQVSNDVSFALTAISDLAARRQAEEAMRRSEHNLTIFFNQAPVGLVWLSADGAILRANQAQLDLLGFPAQDYLGHSFIQDCVEPAQGRELLERLAAQKTVRHFRLALRCKDGAIRHVLADAVSFLAEAASFWKDSHFRYASIFLRDVTDLVKLEREILQAGERESRRIAQDLHDGLGQLLAGTAHMADALQKDLAAKSLPEAGRLDRISKLLYEAIAQARSLSHGLHPVEPESNGLMVALEFLAARTQSLFQTRCRFTCPQPVLIPDNVVATHLFRIAQEAVSNAIKHGKPGRIVISLTGTPERIQLAIKDNGAGMPARQRKNSGMGLRIMRHRAGMINGSLAIQNEPGGGTAVVCSAPVPGAGVPERRIKGAPPGLRPDSPASGAVILKRRPPGARKED